MQKNYGFTLLEVSISALLFAIMLGSATQAMLVDKSTQKVLIAEMGPERDARQALRKLTAELRMAGLLAEDVNGNGTLEAAEDVNENGVLDSDWNLGDGAKNQANLVFNRRVEMRTSREAVTPSTVYSRKIIYRCENNKLVREAISTDFGNGATEKRRTYTLANDVEWIRFSRTGRVITVKIKVLFPEDVFATNERILEEKILLRN